MWSRNSPNDQIMKLASELHGFCCNNHGVFNNFETQQTITARRPTTLQVLYTIQFPLILHFMQETHEFYTYIMILPIYQWAFSIPSIISEPYLYRQMLLSHHQDSSLLQKPLNLQNIKQKLTTVTVGGNR